MPSAESRKVLALAVARARNAPAANVAHAQSAQVAGEYECTRRTWRARPCREGRTALLKSDGRFELQGREGEYLVNGSWVVLNGTC